MKLEIGREPPANLRLEFGRNRRRNLLGSVQNRKGPPNPETFIQESHESIHPFKGEDPIHADLPDLVAYELMLRLHLPRLLDVENVLEKVLERPAAMRPPSVTTSGSKKVAIPAAKMLERIADEADGLQRPEIVAQKGGEAAFILGEVEVPQTRMPTDPHTGIRLVGLLDAVGSALRREEQRDTFGWKNEHLEDLLDRNLDIEGDGGSVGNPTEDTIW